VKYYGFGTPEEALGKTVYVDNFEGVTVAITIVGVVEDIYLRSARDSVDPVLFLVQEDNMWVLNIELHEDNILKTLKDIDAVWNRIVPHFPLSRAFVDDNFNAFYQADEQRAHMFTAFSVFAIIVSCLGLYGLASFTAEQRVKEIGVRKVMGANVADIVRLLTFEFSKPVLLANLLAWPVAWYFAREWLNGFQHRIDLSISYFAVAGGLALVVACVTVAGHAYRTARANPISALRHE
jgi:putative ABC transport system permease protein